MLMMTWMPFWQSWMGSRPPRKLPALLTWPRLPSLPPMKTVQQRSPQKRQRTQR